jgi:diguanylate cyclase (GGDEF)-like protein
MEEMASQIDRTVLEQIQLFQSVDIESIRGIFGHCSVVTLKPGEVLIAPGQFNRKAYFILAGHMRIALNAPEGEPIAVLGPGESVGEMSVIDLQPTSAYAVADTEVRLLAMEEEILWSLVRSSHAIACNLLFYLTRRLRHANSIISTSGMSIDQERCHGHMDALTGLPNREWFCDLLARHVHRAIQADAPLALILIDVDHFKAFNDAYGRVRGDRILYALAYTMTTHLRPTEVIARFGGDDFAILLPNMDMAGVRPVAVRLYETLKAATPVMLQPGDATQWPTLSMGVAALQGGHDADSLLADAEAALFRAKQRGGDAISE